MLSIKLNNDRDIYINKTGLLATCEDLDAIKQDCETAIRSQLGEMIYRIDDGVPTLATVWDKYNQAQFELFARRTLKSVEGVFDVLSFFAKKEGNTLEYYSVIVSTINKETFTIEGFINGV